MTWWILAVFLVPALAIAVCGIAACYHTWRQQVRENEELRGRVKSLEAENHALVFAMGSSRRPAPPSVIPVEEREDEIQAAATRTPRQNRPRRFVSFSQEKRRLENQPVPHKGA